MEALNALDWFCSLPTAQPSNAAVAPAGSAGGVGDAAGCARQHTGLIPRGRRFESFSRHIRAYATCCPVAIGVAVERSATCDDVSPGSRGRRTPAPSEGVLRVLLDAFHPELDPGTVRPSTTTGSPGRSSRAGRKSRATFHPVDTTVQCRDDDGPSSPVPAEVEPCRMSGSSTGGRESPSGFNPRLTVPGGGIVAARCAPGWPPRPGGTRRRNEWYLPLAARHDQRQQEEQDAGTASCHSSDAPNPIECA